VADVAKAKTRRLILFFSWLGLALAGGYFYGRKTSVNWNDEGTAFTYVLHASHRINTPAGLNLVMQMSNATYVFDGTHVRSAPNLSALSRLDLPKVSGEEYQRWLDTTVEAIAAAGAKVAAEETLGSRVAKTLDGISRREWIIISAASVGSFAGGYFLGHTFKEDFNAPKFRSALDDDKTWTKVWQYKQSLLDTKASLDKASANIGVARQGLPGNSQEKQKLDDLEKNIRKQYGVLYQFDPELRSYLLPTRAYSQP
jgi:hypothetical protein